MSIRDEFGRRVSQPDRAFIDQVERLSRQIYDQQQHSIAVGTYRIQEEEDRRILEVLDIQSSNAPNASQLEYMRRLLEESGRQPSTPREYRVITTDNIAPQSIPSILRDIEQELIREQAPLQSPPAIDDGREYIRERMREQDFAARARAMQYLGPDEIDFGELAEGEELEIVARTTTNTTRGRQARTPGRGIVTAPVEKKPPLYIWVVRSSKAYGGQHVQYEVQLNADGSVSCGCAGWRFKKKDEERRCKHTDLVKEEAKDFFKRHKRGEQLPTTMIDENTNSPQTGNSGGENSSIKFGRFIDLD